MAVATAPTAPGNAWANRTAPYPPVLHPHTAGRPGSGDTGSVFRASASRSRAIDWYRDFGSAGLSRYHPRPPSANTSTARRFAASAGYLAHGRPVRSDVLAEAYTNRPFARVLQALDAVRERLRPVFAAAADPFPNT